MHLVPLPRPGRPVPASRPSAVAARPDAPSPVRANRRCSPARRRRAEAGVAATGDAHPQVLPTPVERAEVGRRPARTGPAPCGSSPQRLPAQRLQRPADLDRSDAECTLPAPLARRLDRPRGLRIEPHQQGAASVRQRVAAESARCPTDRGFGSAQDLRLPVWPCIVHLLRPRRPKASAGPWDAIPCLVGGEVGMARSRMSDAGWAFFAPFLRGARAPRARTACRPAGCGWSGGGLVWAHRRAAGAPRKGGGSARPRCRPLARWPRDRDPPPRRGLGPAHAGRHHAPGGPPITAASVPGWATTCPRWRRCWAARAPGPDAPGPRRAARDRDAPPSQVAPASRPRAPRAAHPHRAAHRPPRAPPPHRHAKAAVGPPGLVDPTRIRPWSRDAADTG